MYTEDAYVTEDTYEFETGRMVNVRVKVSDYGIVEEKQRAALPGQRPQTHPQQQQQQQAQDDIIIREDGAVFVVAKNRRTPVTVPKVVALAAAKVGVARTRNPNGKTRSAVKKP